MANIPVIGAKGTFTFDTPYDAVVQRRNVYTCRSLRTIAELKAGRVDVLNIYYTPYYATQNEAVAAYAADEALNTTIIGLVTEANEWVFAPASKCLSYPDVNGVEYAVFNVSVMIGALPTSEDLSANVALLEQRAQELFGTAPQARVVMHSSPAVISVAEHGIVQAARQSRKTNSGTMAQQLIVVQTENDLLKLKLAALEDYIASLV